jgi:hypothetical protein
MPMATQLMLTLDRIRDLIALGEVMKEGEEDSEVMILEVGVGEVLVDLEALVSVGTL